MRCALEAAAVRVAPSMNAQDVANTVWAQALRTTWRTRSDKIVHACHSRML